MSVWTCLPCDAAGYWCEAEYGADWDAFTRIPVVAQEFDGVPLFALPAMRRLIADDAMRLLIRDIANGGPGDNLIVLLRQPRARRRRLRRAASIELLELCALWWSAEEASS